MSNNVSLLVIGLLLGVIIMFLVSKWKNASQKKVVKESSHTVVESIRKVFKIVLVEGFFNELYNFEETKKVLGFIPSTKKALVIIQAKVMIGFDFQKCTWETDETEQKIRLISFPEPEILSIESDYKYYNFDEGLFNLVSRDDLTRIQADGKKQIEAAAIKSDLPNIAKEQMRMMLTEVVQSKNWQIDNLYKISSGGGSSVSKTKA